MIKTQNKTLERQLVEAIVKENFEKFYSLMDNSFYIDLSFADGQDSGKSFLHHCKNVEMAKVLVEKGVNPHQVNQDGMTAIFYAHKMELVNFYLDLKVNYQLINQYNQNILSYVYSDEGYQKAKTFIDLGINPHQKDHEDHTLLHYNNDVDLIKLYIDLGLDVNAKNYYGDSVLHTVYKYPAIKTLLEHGAKADAINSQSYQSVLFTLSNPTLQKIKLLVKHGANPHVLNYKKQNLLHSFFEDQKIVNYLMDLGLDSYLKSKDGITPRDKAHKNGVVTFETYDILKEKKNLHLILDNSELNEIQNLPKKFKI